MNSTPNPVALITGANKGIGKETARRLALLGHTVYLGTRDVERGEDARAELAVPGTDVRIVQLDVTDAGSISGAARRLESEVGHLDVLINNAGVALERKGPGTCDPQLLRQSYEVNLFGQVAVTQAMLRLLRAGSRRVIVNLSSELGSLTLHGYPDFPYADFNFFAYNSSKTALNAFTVSLAKELRVEGFRVNSVNPGYTATDLNRFSGARSVGEAAEVVVQYATLDGGGPTGGFFTEGGTLPW
jgi:NAD(P)-dependent dehydrogenase (short-subunit alcohol dehydrogenase family)